MKLSPLSTIGVTCILGGAAAAGCVKYAVITNPAVLKVATVASVALPVIGILALLVAWLLSRKDTAATDGEPASAKQDLAPPRTHKGQGSEAPTTTPLEASSSTPSQGTEPLAAQKHSETGRNGAGVPPIPTPIGTNSVSSMKSTTTTASAASTTSSAEDLVTPTSSLVSTDTPIPEAPSDLPSSQSSSGSLNTLLASRTPSDRSKSHLAKKKADDDTAAKLAARAAANGLDSLNEPLQPDDLAPVPDPVLPVRGKISKKSKTPANTPKTDDKKKSGALRLNPTNVSTAAAQAAARKAGGSKSEVSTRTCADLDAAYGNST